FALGLSIDAKAGKIQPRLDGSYVSDATSSTAASSTTMRRRRTKCSRTGTAVTSATYPNGSGLGLQYQNSTTLAASLAYSRTSGEADSLSPTTSSAAGENSGHTTSPTSATLSSVCEKSTLTVTNQVYITVTVNSDHSPMSSSVDSASVSGPSTGLPQSVRFPLSSNGTDTSSPAEATQSASSTAPIRSPPAGNVTSNAMKAGCNDDCPVSNAPASRTSSNGGSSTVDPILAQVTTSNAVPTSTVDQSGPTTAKTTASASSALPGTNQTSGDPSDHTREFWAGADIDTVPRMLALPGRTVYDFDGKTIKDPVQILADAGINSFRVETYRGDCVDEKPFVNNASSVANERNFRLDFGCIGTKVKLAKQAIGLGMKMQLTINQGFNIPDGMEKYSYAEMVEEVEKEAKRQLQPFLDANIVPNIILFENEGSDGFLFHEVATGHDRASNDGKVSKDVVNQERCGQIPTGKMNSYPQWAGYNKAEVEACSQAIQAAGFSADAVRYGIHSHGQYVQWKEGVVHGPERPSQTKLTKLDGSPCEGANPIPSDILALDVAEMLTIAGFSAYPDPMRPEDINSDASIELTLDRLNKTLTQLQGYAEEYGKYTDGPFAGQYKLQGLGVEYATRYLFDSDPSKNEIRQQQRHTELMWSLVKEKFSATFLGMMWWEPWYCNNNWEGGEGTLCHLTFDGDKMGEVPTDTLKTWGAAAVSPWKEAKV
ncbi:MAG: hypothetical protein LQ352_005588, partial [Teloschistes flavicans]